MQIVLSLPPDHKNVGGSLQLEPAENKRYFGGTKESSLSALPYIMRYIRQLVSKVIRKDPESTRHPSQKNNSTKIESVIGIHPPPPSKQEKHVRYSIHHCDIPVPVVHRHCEWLYSRTSSTTSTDDVSKRHWLVG